MKVQFPKDITSVSINEVEYTPDDNGQCEVPDALFEDFAVFGVVGVPETAEAPPAGRFESVLKQSVDAVVPLLKDLSEEELQALHDEEKAGKERTTLLEAIHKEQASRSE